MENQKQTFGLLLWLFLLQLLSEGAGLWMIFTLVDWFDSNPAELIIYGWTLLPLWFLWGLRTPRRLRPPQGRAWLVIGLCTALLAALVLVFPDHNLLFTLPQLGTGEALAQLWPGSHTSAAYERQVLPVFIALAHGLLPALFGLGLGLRPTK